MRAASAPKIMEVARQAEEAGVPGAPRAFIRRPAVKIIWAVVIMWLRFAWAAREGLGPRVRRVRHARGRRQQAWSHHFVSSTVGGVTIQ